MSEGAAPISDSAIDSQSVSTAQVSKALGVSVSTVKRWVDEGILPAHKTAGGHRRLYVADVLRLLRKGDFPKIDLAVFGESVGMREESRDALADELFTALQNGDGTRIRAIIMGSFRSGQSIACIADHLISPALRQVGAAWHKGKSDVFHEHRGTQMCMSVLYEIRALLETQAEKERPTAVGGAIEQDHSVLPTLLAQMVLMECGWEAINLGPHTPMASLSAALLRHRPRLIWLSASHMHDVDLFVGEYSRFQRDAEREGVAVVIGGRAFDEAVRRRITYSSFGDGLVHLASFANTLVPTPSLPMRGRPRKSS